MGREKSERLIKFPPPLMKILCGVMTHPLTSLNDFTWVNRVTAIQTSSRSFIVPQWKVDLTSFVHQHLSDIYYRDNVQFMKKKNSFSFST